MKRLFDLVISLLLAPVAFLACLMVAIPIWLEARAPPFFVQYRVGRHEKLFKILKMRTMRKTTPEAVSHDVGEFAILRVGKLLRISKIDELPQLWNVLKGEMSLVGPRPGLASHTELIELRRSHNVFSLMPGITGLSQINGLDMSTPQKLSEMDATYIGPWSMKRDVQILISTVLGKGAGDGAKKSRSIN
ncbi:sugar transferase [Nostoc sp. CHAB 5834]|nr:sugar transferase [Nostoc sp. CHAB 5834]